MLRRVVMFLLFSGSVSATDVPEVKSPSATQPPTSSQPPRAAKYTTETLRGRVVFLAEAQERLLGVGSVAEAKERTLALETRDGKLHALVEDVRGRAFRADPRLREMDVELQVRRYDDSPAVQIIGFYQVKSDGKYEVDYWCDVCAIPMLELKACECCQGDTRLRLRKAE